MLKSLSLFLVALAGSALLISIVTSTGEGRLTGRETLGVVLEDSTRKTFTAGEVSSRLCAPDDEGHCDWNGYFQGVVRMSIIALVMAPVALLTFFVVCFGRLCCNAFGGWQRTPENICYGTRSCGRECLSTEFQGYSKFGVYTTRILLVLCFLGLIGAVIPGLIGNTNMSNGLQRPTRSTINFVHDVQGKVEHIITGLEQLPYTRNINSSLNNVWDSIGHFYKEAHEIDDRVTQVDGYRKAAYIALLILAPVMVLLGILGGVFNVWQITFCSSLLLFLTSGLVWTVFGLQYPLLIIMNDSCREINVFNRNVIASNVSAHLGVPFVANDTSIIETIVPLASCAKSSFASIDHEIQNALDGVYKEACEEYALQSLCLISANNYTTQAKLRCPSEYIDISTQPTCMKMNEYVATHDPEKCRMAVEMSMNMSILTISSNSFQCKKQKLSECQGGGCDGIGGDLIYKMLENLGYLNRYIKIFHEEVFPILGCYLLAPLVAQLTDDVCHQLNPGFESIEMAMLSVAIILIPTTILMLLAAKRWRRDSMETEYHGYLSMGESQPIAEYGHPKYHH